MDKGEANTILQSELSKYRARSYESLQELLDNLDAYEIQAASGVTYQLEVQALWDDKAQENLRVSASIDDGGLISSFLPLSDDFIISPNGEFVGE